LGVGKVMSNEWKSITHVYSRAGGGASVKVYANYWRAGGADGERLFEF
jgi:hypothetical protein